MTLLPKSFDFFECFERMSDKIVAASDALIQLYDNEGERAAIAAQIKELEHAADEVTHETLERLNRTFITPLEREDIHNLITSMDNVIDMIHAVGSRVLVFKPKQIPSYIRDMAQLLRQGVGELEQSVREMRDTKHQQRILAHCIEINRIENLADDKLREGLTQLFENESDPIELIKLKETLENLEHATDACEHVANVIEGIVLKHA